jgi:ketosteroid isomerase-like protein
MKDVSILSVIRASILVIGFVTAAAPAFADDADVKQQLRQMGDAYVERFDKQDASGVAALYATGAIIVDLMGARTDIQKVYERTFKLGINHIESDVDQIVPFESPDAALATGRYRLTGNNENGSPIVEGGIWTATFVREGGKWKIGMLTTIPRSAAK